MKTVATLLSFAVMFTAALMAPSLALAQEGREFASIGIKTLEFDIAENGERFVFDEMPVHEDLNPPQPAYGNPFVTEGYISPLNTLNGSNGVNPDGSPEFPDKVIGKWTCRGWYIGDGRWSTPAADTSQLPQSLASLVVSQWWRLLIAAEALPEDGIARLPTSVPPFSSSAPRLRLPQLARLQAVLPVHRLLQAERGNKPDQSRAGRVHRRQALAHQRNAFLSIPLFTDHQASQEHAARDPIGPSLRIRHRQGSFDEP
jgi:hypothetical protein